MASAVSGTAIFYPLPGLVRKEEGTGMTKLASHGFVRCLHTMKRPLVCCSKSTLNEQASPSTKEHSTKGTVQQVAGALLSLTVIFSPQQAQAMDGIGIGSMEQQMIVQTPQQSSLLDKVEAPPLQDEASSPSATSDAVTPEPATADPAAPEPATADSASSQPASADSAAPATAISAAAEPATPSTVTPAPIPSPPPPPAPKSSKASAAKPTGAKLDTQVDEINAYSYKFPLNIPSKNEDLPWIVSRQPERYSSAAPISADARQRIVSSRLDFQRNLTCTVSVGPPNSLYLQGKDPMQWQPRNVAESVLQDKLSPRMTSGQRQAESDIEVAKKVVIDGIPYFYYEFVQQKSPTSVERRIDTYRHNLSVTAEREGYLYTLNFSTPDTFWKDLEPLFREAIASFRLDPPTQEYVPPYKDPWRFW